MVNIRNFALTVLLMGDVKKSATMYIVFMTVLIALLGLRFVGNIVFFFFFATYNTSSNLWHSFPQINRSQFETERPVYTF